MTSGGLGEAGVERSAIQNEEESDSLSLFLFPALRLSRGLAFLLSVLLGPRDPRPLGILQSRHHPKGMRVRSHCWERGRERGRLLEGEGSQAQIPRLLQLQSFLRNKETEKAI